MQNKLAALRQKMQEKGLDAYIVHASDAHQSEYIAAHWQTRAWLSGFTGSSGIVVVTATEAGLWTDGRYFVQANKELAGSGISLFKMGEPGVPKYEEFLADKLPQNSKLGFDGRVFSISGFETLKENLSHKNITYHYNEDLAGELWTDRPSLPSGKAFAHDIKFTGKSLSEKLTVRAEMQKNRADVYLVATLDDIAWFTNIRGFDTPNTPAVFSYLLIGMEEAFLFVDKSKLEDIKLSDDISVYPYEAIFEHLSKYANNKSLLYNTNGVSVSLFDAIPKTAKAIKGSNIIAGLKGIKNEVEIKNMRNAFTKEGVVMLRFAKWLSECKAEELPDEVGVQNKVSALRLEMEHCIGDSFTTIAAYGENAALCHYSPKKETCSQLKPEGFLLLDTGGQYLDGTTDITRTIVLGPISDEMRKGFTLVLKAHIALARAKFAQGAAGCHLDVIARQHMWEAGMDYKHGTGHGIGYCLGVHEGPHSIGQNFNDTRLVPGMVCSNEPGLYNEGRFGIRSETIILVKELEKNEYGNFLGFETLTLFPYDLKAIDVSMLDEAEKAYLNAYHKMVYDKLLPHITSEEAEWLREATKAI